MILTGEAIREARKVGDIVLEPFEVADLNPNSYNFHLGSTLLCVLSSDGQVHERDIVTLPPDGFVMQPHVLYIAHTNEVIGSTRYVSTLLGRSSVGRLGLFLNKTADLGHAGSMSQWTLEMSVIQPVRIYPGVRIGQVAFWVQHGTLMPYDGRYHRDLGPVLSRDPSLSRFVP